LAVVAVTRVSVASAKPVASLSVRAVAPLHAAPGSAHVPNCSCPPGGTTGRPSQVKLCSGLDAAKGGHQPVLAAGVAPDARAAAATLAADGSTSP
jgi:hypothetical protein